MSHNQVLDDSPWLAPEAIQQIELFLGGRESLRVWEWGAGGSTMWFAERAAMVVSVEHDPEWHAQILRRLRERNVSNVGLMLWTNPSRYVYAIANHAPMSFGLILVDGVQRNACVLAALGQLQPGDWLILDNTEREIEYAEALSLLKDWERHDYQGDGFQTSIFVKP